MAEIAAKKETKVNTAPSPPPHMEGERWKRMHRQLEEMMGVWKERCTDLLQADVDRGLALAGAPRSNDDLPPAKGAGFEWGWKNMEVAFENQCAGFIWFETDHLTIWERQTDRLLALIRQYVLPDAVFQIIPGGRGNGADPDNHPSRARIAVLMAIPESNEKRAMLTAFVNQGVCLWAWDPELGKAVPVPIIA